MERSAPSPRLVLRFAVGSLVAFVLVGAGVGAILTRFARASAEDRGTFHARFIANAVLPLALDGVDLTHPVTGADRSAVDAFVDTRILSDGRDIRIKIWRPDGTIVYSDEPRLIGMRFPEETGDLDEALQGHAESGVSDLAEAENVYERGLADKLFFTYVPLRLEPNGPPVAVAEIYQDYAVLQGDIDGLLRTLGLTLGAGLLLLYAALLPIATRASRDMREQNERLNELLEREQATVEELRELNVKKDDFVAAASHELRTPLTSIIGYLSTLRNPQLADDARAREEFMRAAEVQARRLLRLITNVLRTADLQESDATITPERIDLTLMLRDVLHELGAETRVRVDLATDASTVVTDRAKLSEIVTNVVDNALKYSPPDAPVDVIARRAPAADAVSIAVRDRGIGVADEDRETIFERFQQKDQSATRRYGGLGLGLHVVRGLVRQLGGEISVEAQPDGGTTFTLDVPSLEALQPEHRAAAATARAAASGPRGG